MPATKREVIIKKGTAESDIVEPQPYSPPVLVMVMCPGDLEEPAYISVSDSTDGKFVPLQIDGLEVSLIRRRATMFRLPAVYWRVDANGPVADDRKFRVLMNPISET